MGRKTNKMAVTRKGNGHSKNRIPASTYGGLKMATSRRIRFVLPLYFAVICLGLIQFTGKAREMPPSLERAITFYNSMSFEVSYDSWISSNTSENNYGDDKELWVGVFSYGVQKVERQTLLWFDISGLPEGAVVDGAVLEMSQTRADGVESYQIWPYKITGEWQEDGVTWQNAPNAFNLGDPAASLDYAPGIKSWDVTKIVQDWQTDQQINGILLAGDGTSVGTRVFRAHENIGDPPRLRIDYHRTSFELYLPLIIQ